MQKIPNKINNILEEFIIGVKDILGDKMKKIILYGSYARGDYKKDSDIDIMILTDLEDNEISKYRDKIWELAYNIEFDNNFDVNLSPLIKNIDKFNYWLEALPFYINVQNEGVILSK